MDRPALVVFKASSVAVAKILDQAMGKIDERLWGVRSVGSATIDNPVQNQITDRR